MKFLIVQGTEHEYALYILHSKHVTAYTTKQYKNIVLMVMVTQNATVEQKNNKKKPFKRKEQQGKGKNSE